MLRRNRRANESGSTAQNNAKMSRLVSSFQTGLVAHEGQAYDAGGGIIILNHYKNEELRER